MVLMIGSRQKKITILTVVLILLLFFLHYTRILSPFERAFIFITKPVLGSVYSLSSGVGQNYLSLKSKLDLQRENKELKDELIMLIKEKAKFNSEEEENKFLRSQLNLQEPSQFRNVIARVVGRNIDQTINTLVLDVGSTVGVKIGQPVLGDQGVVIGKIVKVNKNSSFALLINDDFSKLAVKIQNQTKTIGLLEGEYGLGLKLHLIPQVELLKEGDLVVTSGLEQSVPANLVVGQIEKITTEPEELFQEASIKSLVNFNKITMVNILINDDDN